MASAPTSVESSAAPALPASPSTEMSPALAAAASAPFLGAPVESGKLLYHVPTPTEEEAIRHIMLTDPSARYVFSSALNGKHMSGTAYNAFQHYGAEVGVSEGPTGRAYAIPTRGRDLAALSLLHVEFYCRRFIGFAAERPAERFIVTRIGTTGATGWPDAVIAPFFLGASPNVVLPFAWIMLLRRYVGRQITALSQATALGPDTPHR